MVGRSVPRWWLGAALAVVAATFLGSAAWVHAQDNDDQSVVVAAGETHTGNLYAFGNEIVVDGTVTGDLVGAASTVRVGPRGVIQGDVLAAGAGVLVAGKVNGDVRGAAYTVQVEDGGQVGGDLVGAAYSLGVGTRATVGGDVLAVGYQLLIDGTVEHDVRFGGASLDIDGTVAGDVNASVASPEERASRPFVPNFGNQEMPSPPRFAAPGLHVGPDAAIGGSLTYTSSAESEIPEAAVSGTVDFNEVAPKAEAAPEEPAQPAQDWLFGGLRSFAALVLVGLLILWLAPRVLGAGAEVLRRRPAASLGYGLLTFVGDIAAIVALIIAFVLAIVVANLLTLGSQLGLPIVAATVVIGTLLTFGFLLLLLLGVIVAGYALGAWLLRSGADAGLGRRIGALLLGLAIVAVVITIPWGIGTLVHLIVALFGVGALALAGLGRRQKAAPMAPVAPLPDAT